MTSSGIVGKTAKDKKIAASCQLIKTGNAIQDMRNFVREIKTSIDDGISKTNLKRKVTLIERALSVTEAGVKWGTRNSCVISGTALEYTVNRSEVEAKRRRVEAGEGLPPPVTRQNPVRRLTKSRRSDVQKAVERLLGDAIQETLDVPTRKQPSRLVPEVSPTMPEVSHVDAYTPCNGRVFTPTEAFHCI
jgi:hypothetical protein